MQKRIIAISGDTFPGCSPRVSRPLREHETFPVESESFYVEELQEGFCVMDVTADTAVFYVLKAVAEQLRDKYNWSEESVSVNRVA
jgi:hypothetical protein